MVPKSRVPVVVALLFAIQAVFPNPCDDFYAKVTYALNHGKKAMTATNFEHQKYYAERAYEALENSKSFMGSCNCAKAETQTTEAMESLDKASVPADWEAGRFFTKKALAQINDLITSIDQCTQGTAHNIDFAQAAGGASNGSGSVNSMELEMIKIFDRHAAEKLQQAQAAIAQLMELSSTIGQGPVDADPNSLSAHQRAYLDKARRLLENGLQQLGGK